ncbi:MAG: DUF6932 family protein [Bifidobacterium crudilactis]|uniref:DUF6932 family protein n=1 Tax=Bifidobacterium crudilactis TaxID=327277 RepID=UPI003F9A4F8D
MALPSSTSFLQSEVLPYRGKFMPYAANTLEIETLLAFNQDRQYLWQQFLAFRGAALDFFGKTRFFINGSYVTIKTNPKDIDVVLAPQNRNQAYDALEADPNTASSLLTSTKNGIRIQPFGGAIDSFLCLEDNGEISDYWDGFWSQVNVNKGYLSKGILQKGYVEVIGQ